MYKQIIIVRKDLGMSIGKICNQVSHASMAFLTNQIKENSEKVLVGCSWYKAYKWEYNSGLGEFEKKPVNYKRADLFQWAKEATEKNEFCFYAKPVNPNDPFGKFELCEPTYEYKSELVFDTGLYEEWINGIFTKVVLGAKNRNQLLKAKTMAEEMGMVEGRDFFLIKDCCLTELEPEEYDENGVGRTLTCIGFVPMESEIIDKIGKKYQLYK